MQRRTVISLVIAAALLTALGVALMLKAKAPPEAARLLPESDAIVYLNVKTLRAATHFDQTPVGRSADLQHFIDATGIVPERDLDAAAFALHRMPDPHGPNGPVAYSEVLVGRFDGQRLAQYLASIASSKESYAGHDVYAVPIDGRTLRVAQLGYDTIGASNMPTPEQIHSMLDRARASGLGTPGSALLAARYGEVPLLSQAWGIGHIGLPFAEGGHLSVLGMELPLDENTDLVASLRYSGSLHLRVEEIAPSDAVAAHTAETMNGLLGFLKALETAQAAKTPSEAAVQGMVNSAEITHHGDRTTLNAVATTEQLRALSSSATQTPAAP